MAEPDFSMKGLQPPFKQSNIADIDFKAKEIVNDSDI